MNQQQAQSAVSISAFVVAAIYAYRRLVESSTTAKPAASTGHFVIGFGFTYTTLAVLAQGAPELGGMFAILVVVGDILTNGKALTADITTNLNRTKATAPAATAATSSGLNFQGLPALSTTPTGTTPVIPGTEDPETPGGN